MVLKVPFVFRYLVMELLACNVAVSFTVDSVQPAHDLPAPAHDDGSDDDAAEEDEDADDEDFGYEY